MKPIPAIGYLDPLEVRQQMDNGPNVSQGSKEGILSMPNDLPNTGIRNPPARPEPEAHVHMFDAGGSGERPIMEILTKILKVQEEILELSRTTGASTTMKSNGNRNESKPVGRITPSGVSSKKIVGKVTPVERDEIRALFERKNGLTELFRSLSTLTESELRGSSLYERIVADMSEVTTRFQNWWDTMSKKYSWENVAGYKWEIDFNTCDIFLNKQ